MNFTALIHTQSFAINKFMSIFALYIMLRIYKETIEKMSDKNSDTSKFLITKIIAQCAAFFLFCLLPLKGMCQTGEDAVNRLVEMGYENVGWTEDENERVYVLQNSAYRLQGVGLSKAVDVIQKTGLPERKPCRIVVLDNGVPQISLTYHAHAEDTVAETRKNWKVSYDIGESWSKIREKKNKSLYKIDILVYPQLYFKNYIITQIYQALLEFSPAIEISFWKGMKLTGQIVLPVYNDGYGDSAGKVHPGYLTLAQKFRLPHNMQGTATIGMFDSNTYGMELALFCPLKDERFSLEGKIGYVGYGYWHGFKFRYNEEYTSYWSVGGNFYWPKYNTQFKLRGEQYLLKEKGVRFEMIRHFRYASIGFYAVKAEGAKANGGFKFFVALPPYKHKRHKYIPRVSTSLGTGITYNAGNEKYYYHMPYSNASDNMMQQNSFNPYFIKSEL